MRGIVAIGNEAICAGFALAGIEVHCPGADAAGQEALERRFAEALGHAAVVVLSGDCAARLPAPILAAARERGAPLVAVLPVLGEPGGTDPLVERVRAALGIAS